MLFYAEKRVAQLKERGYANAGLYNPEGVGGSHYMMILHNINKPETYGMPIEPRVPVATEIRQDWLKPLGAAGLLATAGIALLPLGHCLCGPGHLPDRVCLLLSIVSVAEWHSGYATTGESDASLLWHSYVCAAGSDAAALLQPQQMEPV
jgi:hypothetical protein